MKKCKLGNKLNEHHFPYLFMTIEVHWVDLMANLDVVCLMEKIKQHELQKKEEVD